MILIATVIGFTSRDMETFGSLIRKRLGPHIKLEDGFGSLTTAGPGCHMSRGAGRHITMAGGSIIAIHGAGGPDLYMSAIGRCGLRHSSSLSDLDIAPVSALAPLDGCPWVRMIRFIRGTDAASIA